MFDKRKRRRELVTNVRLSYPMLIFWRLDVGGLVRETRQWTSGGTVLVLSLVTRSRGRLTCRGLSWPHLMTSRTTASRTTASQSRGREQALCARKKSLVGIFALCAAKYSLDGLGGERAPQAPSLLEHTRHSVRCLALVEYKVEGVV